MENQKQQSEAVSWGRHFFFPFPICQKANEREENVSAMFHSALNTLWEVSDGFIAKESISPSLIVRDNFGNEQGEGFSKLNHNKLMMMVYNNTNKNRTITEPRMAEQCNITSPSITAIVTWLMNIFPYTLSLYHRLKIRHVSICLHFAILCNVGILLFS